MEDFLTHVTEGTNYAAGQRGTPTDFLRFHAKGSPKVIDGHVRMGIAAQLATIDEGFRMIAARTSLRTSPSSSANRIRKDARPARDRTSGSDR